MLLSKLRTPCFINITKIYIQMPYTLNDDDNHILDENGNKIEFTISYIETNDWYKHREPIHINDDGHLDTEDRHLIVKDGISPNHAVSKNQLDQLNNNIYSKQDIDNKLLALQKSINQITTELQILNFRNDKINNHLPNNFNSN